MSGLTRRFLGQFYLFLITIYDMVSNIVMSIFALITNRPTFKELLATEERTTTRSFISKPMASASVTAARNPLNSSPRRREGSTSARQDVAARSESASASTVGASDEAAPPPANTPASPRKVPHIMTMTSSVTSDTPSNFPSPPASPLLSLLSFLEHYYQRSWTDPLDDMIKAISTDSLSSPEALVSMFEL
jgi:hypothetical protein